MTSSIEIGLSFDISALAPSLTIGETQAIFQWSGMSLISSEVLNRYIRESIFIEGQGQLNEIAEEPNYKAL